MAQYLLFPFKRGQIICGYKTAQYRKSWGYNHFGIDVSSYQGYSDPSVNDHSIYASGDGEVIWCKKDVATNSLGYALAIRYNNVYNHDGVLKDVVVRYMHSANCYVKKGDKVNCYTKILDEGKSGTESYHVHIEFDYDVGYPQYTPQVASGHSGWTPTPVGYPDTTLNPSLYLWQSAQRRQDDYNFSNRSWINPEDEILPSIQIKSEDNIETQDKDLKLLQSKFSAFLSELKTLIDKYE